MTEEIRKWEWFERSFLDPLYEYATGKDERAGFSAEAAAAYLGIEVAEASDFVQSYLGATRSPRSETKYVLRREGRTKNAIWYVGSKTRDAKRHLGQFGSDVRRKITRTLEPDLRRIGEINPRALPAIQAGIVPAIDAFSELIGAVFTMAGFTADEDEDHHG